MGDFHFGGTDEESAEIKKLNAEVVSYILPLVWNCREDFISGVA
jgi:hypothetical protein